MTDPFACFDNEILPATVAPSKNTTTFACVACCGTGFYQGARVHEERSECFVCKGTGRSKYAAREQATRRAAAKISHQKAEDTKRRNAIRAAEEAGVYEWMRGAGWCRLAVEFFANVQSGKALTDRQIEVMRDMKAKDEARQIERAAAREAAAAPVDLSPVMAMFRKAEASGLKVPTYRAAGLALSLAKAQSANPGAIYVKDTESGEYLGKVIRGKFQPAHGAQAAAVAEILNTIAADPAGVAKMHGIKTGRCSCCGRELTDPDSIANGIGPICASSWGF